MRLDEIRLEFETSGRIGGDALASLRHLLRTSGDPYEAITVAGDCGAFALATDLANHLDHRDPMVRWNAAGVLFTRFRDPTFAARCLEMAVDENDEIARGVALAGLGELLPKMKDHELRQRMASTLVSVFEDRTELVVMRGAAYEGFKRRWVSRHCPESQHLD